MGKKVRQSKKGAVGADDPAATAKDGGADTGTADRESAPIEKGGPKGPEPTRFGDWEKNGRCTDF